MIIAMIAIVVIVGSLLYYFVFFKPEQNKSELAFQKAKYETEQKEKQDDKQALEEGLKQAKKNYLEMILAIEKSSYPMEQYKTLMDMAKDLYQADIDNLYKQYDN